MFVAFPVDAGRTLRVANYELVHKQQSVLAECDDVTHQKRMTIRHPRPPGAYYDHDYLALTTPSAFGPESFLRHKAMVPNNSKLFHRGRSVCKLDAEWAPDVATEEGFDTTELLATVARYVLETRDSPFLYESEKGGGGSDQGTICGRRNTDW